MESAFASHCLASRMLCVPASRRLLSRRDRIRAPFPELRYASTVFPIQTKGRTLGRRVGLLLGGLTLRQLPELWVEGIGLFVSPSSYLCLCLCLCLCSCNWFSSRTYHILSGLIRNALRSYVESQAGAGGGIVDHGVNGRMLSSRRWDGYQERRTARLIVV